MLRMYCKFYRFLLTAVGILCLLLFVSGSKAQKLSFDSWDTEAGLAQNSVYSICQDKQGFLWIGTGGVVNRFDGKEFRIFQLPAESGTNRENGTNCIISDKNDLLWIATNTGVWQLDIKRNKYKRAYFNSRQKMNTRCLFQDSQSNIWAGTDSGVYRLTDPERAMFAKFGSYGKDGIDDAQIQSIFVDSENNLWLGTRKGVTNINLSAKNRPYKHYKHSPEDPQSLSSNIISSITSDNYHNLWIGTQQQGLNLLHKDKGNFTRVNSNAGNLKLPSNNVRTIRPDSEGNIWVGTQEGLARINWQEQTATSYRHDPKDKHSLSQNSIHSIYIDSNNQVWIGTFFGGINLINPYPSVFKVLQNNGTPSGLSNNVVSAVTTDRSGNLWIGTEGGGVNLYNKSANILDYYTHTDKKIGSNLIKTIYRDKDGNIWVGTHAGGLNLYSGGSFKKYFYHAENPSFLISEITTIAEDEENNLWLGMQGGIKGVTIYKRNGTSLTDVSHNYERSILKGKNIKVVFPDSRNNIWIATSSGLFVKKNGSKAVVSASNLLKPGSTLLPHVTCISEDLAGNIWFGTENQGVKKYNPQKRKIYTYAFAQQKGENKVYGILEDREGFVWLGTGNGLIRLEPATGAFQSYTKADGLPSNAFNFNAYYKGDDGMFYFGTYNGLISFDPSSFLINRTNASVVFTGLKTLNQQGVSDINHSEALTLSHRENVFTIEFALLNYIKPAKNRYAYRLKGFDKEWIETDNPSVTYMNLNPGDYTLAVKGGNNDGIWGETKELSIVVLPPFWRTWWAYMIYISVAAGVLFVVIRFFYLRELIKKEKVLHQSKLDFFTNVTHEIRTHLTLILSPVDKMIADRSTDGYLQQQFQYIKRNAGNLLRLSEELMDFRKAETENMHLQIAPYDIVSFTKDIYEHFTEISLSRDMQISFTHNVQDPIIYFDPVQLEKVFFNLISNAFKFTPDGGIIQVHIEDLRHLIKVSVSDNGRGIAPEYKDKLFNNFFQVNDSGSQNKGYGIGLALSSKIAALHGARIEVESERSTALNAERCTTFSVFLQKGSEHFNRQFSTPAPQVTLDRTFNQASAHEQKIQPSNFVLPGKETADLKKFNVLVVDDNPGIRQTVQEVLESKHHVVLKDNAAAGWAYASEQLPDIIISDVMMPEEDGFSFCNRIKSDVRTCHIPVILLTAKSAQQDHIEGLYKGADLYLTKPFNRTVLELNVSNLLTTSERIRQSVAKRIENGLLNAPVRNDHKKTTTNTLDDEFLKQVLDIIEKNLDEPDFSVTALAQKVAMSVPVLYKKMKAVADMSVNDFIKSVKLQKAADLLVNTNMAVYEVCYAVGFQDRKHFSAEFKKRFGTSPKQYAIGVRNSPVNAETGDDGTTKA